METCGTHAGNATPLQCHPSGIQHWCSPFRVSEYQVILPSDAPWSIFYSRLALDFRGVFRAKGKRDVNENHFHSLYRSQLSTGGGLKGYRKHEKSLAFSTEVLLQFYCILLNSGEFFKSAQETFQEVLNIVFYPWLFNKLWRKLSNCKPPTSVLSFMSSPAEFQSFFMTWTHV